MGVCVLGKHPVLAARAELCDCLADIPGLYLGRSVRTDHEVETEQCLHGEVL